MNTKVLELTDDEISEFFIELFNENNINAEKTNETHIEDFATWVAKTIYDATILSMLYDRKLKLGYDKEEGFGFDLSQEIFDKFPHFNPENQLWQQISDLIESKDLEEN